MIEWEELSLGEKQAIKLISEQSLMGFQKCFFNILTGEKWAVNWHHKYIAHTIEEIIDGKRGSTIFNVPPGAGKTEILSIHAPVYSILKCQKVRNLNVSFSDSLVKKNSDRSRDIIKSEEFQELWPMETGKWKSEDWQTLNEKGKVRAEIASRSLNGQITGGRGGYMLDGFSGWVCIDDPDKPADMFSEVKRTKVHNTIVNTLRSRRASKSKDNPTPFVLMQQRLHIDDTTAFLMDKNRGIGVDFDQIIIPALINEEYIESLPEWIREECRAQVCGSEKINGYWSFWPQNEDINDLMELWKRNEYTFLSQYMQAPISLGGFVFDSKDFRMYGPESEFQLPEYIEYRFITSDTAQKTANHNDFTVICEWGVKDEKLYLLNMVRDKWEAKDLRLNFIKIVNEAWSRNSLINGNLRTVLVEDKVSGTGLIQEMKGELPLPVKGLPRSVDKLTRALDAAPQVSLGKVWLPAEAPWLTDFVAEHSLFTPNDSHKHDDMVDNTCDAINHVFLKPTSSITSLMFKRKR